MTPGLLLLADGRFPAGGHAYSAGVEAAVRAGDVIDVTSMGRYLRGRLATSGVTESAVAANAAGLALAFRARSATRPTTANDAFGVLDAEYDARVLSPRLRATSRRLGRQLCRAAASAWSHPALESVAATAAGPHQPIALGVAVVAAGGGPGEAAAIAMHHLATAVVTASVRLLGLDPIACTAVQAEVSTWSASLIDDARAWAATPPEQLPGAGGSLTEILGEHHGTWDHRLFVA